MGYNTVINGLGFTGRQLRSGDDFPEGHILEIKGIGVQECFMDVCSV
jgi:hypothetical protein